MRAAMVALLLLGACGDDMRVQRRENAQARSAVAPWGAAARDLPEGVVAQGDLALDAIAEAPPPVTAALLARGRERFDIFCAPCHGLAGDGDGIIVQRGFPAPPSFHADRLRRAPARHFYTVATDGLGVMYPQAARVSPADRWAIIAYIRALQATRESPG